MSYWENEGVGFDTLRGRILTAIERSDEQLRFVTATDSFLMRHYQDCCEHVRIEEIVGELDDLVGSPILLAEEVSNADGPAPEYPESYTWPFYKLATQKGHVTIRWLGESNGYYSESVDFQREKFS